MTHSLRSALSALVISLPVMLGAAAASTAGEENLIIKPSPHDVPTTVQRLQAAASSRGATVAATIDHAAAAEAHGLSLRPTVLVLFGNPKLGTPLMQSRQTVGLDLPLRVLVWQDAGGATQLGYAPPDLVASRLGFRWRQIAAEQRSSPRPSAGERRRCVTGCEGDVVPVAVSLTSLVRPKGKQSYAGNGLQPVLSHS